MTYNENMEAIIFEYVRGGTGMNHAFFARFHPRIIDVLLRDRSFWKPDPQHSGMLYFETPSSTRRNFMFAFDGTATMDVEGVVYPLAAGSVFYFPFGSRVRLTAPSDRPLQFYSIQYDYVLIDREGDAVRYSEPAERNLPLPNAMRAPDIRHFASGMRHVYDLWHEKNADYEWKTRLAFLNLLDEVIEWNSERLADELAYRSIKRCMEYIKSHYDEPLEREKLAEIASLSASYFSVVFKKVSGYTPTQYITKVRMDKAKQLLQNSSMTVSEVARSVGFQDPLYFGRVFSSYTGMPPREFKKA